MTTPDEKPPPGPDDIGNGPYISPQPDPPPRGKRRRPPDEKPPPGPDDIGNGPYISPQPDPPEPTIEEILADRYPWLLQIGPLFQVYVDGYIQFGEDHEAALRYMRTSPLYDEYFAGNRRDDGTFVWNEADYFLQIAGFEQAIEDAGVNPELFRDRFPDLIAGEIDAITFNARLMRLQEEIWDRGPSARAAYANLYGDGFEGELTNAALLAMFMDDTGDINQAIFEKRLSIAQISGDAYQAGFGFSERLARRIYKEGKAQQAEDFFKEGAEQVPFLARLAQRHDDPNDPFDISDFADAILFGNAETRQRLRRMTAAEAGLFTRTGQAIRQGARVTGLEEF